MRKIILLILMLLCATFFSCTFGQIEAVVYNDVSETVTISLDENNYVDKPTVISKIRLTKGSFTSDPITFDIPGFSTPSRYYTLDGFSPSLEKGKTYYFVFEEGAFGNYGAWYDLSETRWESDTGLYKLDI